MSLVIGDDINHAVFFLHRYRTNFRWRKVAQAATLNHCGPRHANPGTARCYGKIGTTKERCVTGKAVAIIHRDTRYNSTQFRPGTK